MRLLEARLLVLRARGGEESQGSSVPTEAQAAKAGTSARRTTSPVSSESLS